MKHNRLNHQLIESIYQAAAEPDSWKSVLNTIAGLIRADGCNLIFLDSESSQVPFIESTLDGPECLALYANQYVATDPWRFLEREPAGQFYLGQQVVSNTELAASECYEAFLKPRQHHHYIGATFIHFGTLAGILSSMRSDKRTAFGSEELDILQPLITHLNRACIISTQLAKQQSITEAVSAASDSAPVGIVYINQQQQVVSFNQQAEAVMNTGDISCYQKNLKLTNHLEDKNLAALIYGAVTEPLTTEKSGGRVIHISRQGRPSLQLMVLPYRSSERQQDIFGSTIRCIVFITNGKQQQPSIKSFASLYDLTSKQAEVCEGILLDKTVQEIADDMQISRDGIKHHMRAVFAKTGATRQAQLVKIIYSSLAVFEKSSPR